MLLDKENRILDVAVTSHETFTRAFKDVNSLTPEQYRDKPVRLNSFEKPELLLNYVMIDEGVPLISEGLVLEMNRRTLEAPVYFTGCLALLIHV